jgi:hypothetical protein
MMSQEREIYRSANGDRWFLCREGERVFVLHNANEPSGGKSTLVELGDFLRSGNAGPEHQALRHMIGSLLDGTPPSKPDA